VKAADTARAAKQTAGGENQTEEGDYAGGLLNPAEILEHAAAHDVAAGELRDLLEPV